MKTIWIREAGMLEWIYYVQPEDLSLILSSQEGLRAPSYLEGNMLVLGIPVSLGSLVILLSQTMTEDVAWKLG